VRPTGSRIPALGGGAALPLCIAVTVLAFNLFGDGVQGLLDPRLSPAFLRSPSGSTAPTPWRRGRPAMPAIAR